MKISVPAFVLAIVPFASGQCSENNCLHGRPISTTSIHSNPEQPTTVNKDTSQSDSVSTSISHSASDTSSSTHVSDSGITKTVTVTAAAVTSTITDSSCAVPISSCGLGGLGVIEPKVVIISLFTPEAAVWPGPLGLTIPVTVAGFSPLFPSALCSTDSSICQVTTGEGEINAASTVTALIHNNCFNLSKTYFLIGGIAGINPACGTIGGVALAHYAVQVGLSYEVDAREIEDNYTSGYIPLGSSAPNDYPVFLYGTESFELSTALQDRAFLVASQTTLNDSNAAQEYRALYPNSPANQAPTVFKGDAVTSDVYWHGELLAQVFDNYTTLLTNSSGRYCMTDQEDAAILEAMVRGAMTNILDFSRIILMRTAANFDRPPPGKSATQQLLYTDQGAFDISVANIYQAGRPIVDDIINNWDDVYRQGIEVRNYIGDVFGSIKNQAFAQAIGSIFAQEG